MTSSRAWAALGGHLGRIACTAVGLKRGRRGKIIWCLKSGWSGAHPLPQTAASLTCLFPLPPHPEMSRRGCVAFAGHHDEALAVAERGRTRAFADLLVERQTGQQDSDPYSPVTVDQVLEIVNGQRGLVLYFSLAAGYLYSWLLAPGTGRVGGWEHTPPARGPCCSPPPAPLLSESAASSVPPGWAWVCACL